MGNFVSACEDPNDNNLNTDVRQMASGIARDIGNNPIKSTIAGGVVGGIVGASAVAIGSAITNASTAGMATVGAFANACGAGAAVGTTGTAALATTGAAVGTTGTAALATTGAAVGTTGTAALATTGAAVGTAGGGAAVVGSATGMTIFGVTVGPIAIGAIAGVVIGAALVYGIAWFMKDRKFVNFKDALNKCNLLPLYDMLMNIKVMVENGQNYGVAMTELRRIVLQRPELSPIFDMFNLAIAAHFNCVKCNAHLVDCLQICLCSIKKYPREVGRWTCHCLNTTHSCCP